MSIQMVNYLAGGSLTDDYSFGGAFVISAEGEVLASHPLGEEGMLLVELHEALGSAQSPMHHRPGARGTKQ